MVSLAPVKQWATEYLAASSKLRSLILDDPEEMARTEALIKLETYNKLLMLELGR
jgi:hypothetical protein